ncbi:MAG: T9SS type A sorting domain-containing protein [candidate division Zixibacteria bacterium]|nr:T9SS type A sorting domain-containing protein [candidate division Zixibacteria bacterium]
MMKFRFVTGLVFLAVLMALPGMVLSNPIVDPLFEEYSIDPSWVSFITVEDTNALHFKLIVDGDTVAIDSDLIIHPFTPVILNQENTSGFNLSHTGSELIILNTNTGWEDRLAYGILSPNVAPPFGYHSYRWQGYWYEMFLPVLDNELISEHGNTEVIINEISMHNTWGDGNYIELYNRSDGTIDISSWEILCNTRFIIPAGTYIEPHGFYTLRERDFPQNYNPLYGGDNIYLVNSDNSVVDQVGWDSDHGTDISFMRYPDGYVEDRSGYMGFNDQTSSESFSNGFPTRNGANTHLNINFIVIGTDACHDGQYVRIIWTDPVWDVDYAGTKLIRSKDHFPQDVEDGSLIYEGNDGEFDDYDLEINTTYYYTAFAYTNDGQYSPYGYETSDSVTVTMVGVDDDDGAMPSEVVLLDNCPNPFNASTNIRYVLPVEGHAKLEIFNLMGQHIATLVDNFQNGGYHTVNCDISEHTSGIYFYKLTADEKTSVKRMVLLK